jgi:hypothetical protein
MSRARNLSNAGSNITTSGVYQKQLTGDGQGLVVKGSYTGNPNIFEVTQTSSDGYAYVRDAVGNTTQFTGYPAGLNIIRGRMTMPEQPRFFARSNYSSSGGPSGVYILSTVDVNVGNAYSSSNGRFTAPITGTYYLFASALSRNTGTLNGNLRLNGSTVIVYSEDSRSSGFGDIHPTMLYNLAAGDYVEFYCSNSTYGNVYDYFGGWLVA